MLNITELLSVRMTILVGSRTMMADQILSVYTSDKNKTASLPTSRKAF